MFSLSGRLCAKIFCLLYEFSGRRRVKKVISIPSIFVIWNFSQNDENSLLGSTGYARAYVIIIAEY